MYGIKFVGKAWQIRARLREWKNQSLTLSEWILRQQNQKPHFHLVKLKAKRKQELPR